jgi:hypothetical protein
MNNQKLAKSLGICRLTIGVEFANNIRYLTKKLAIKDLLPLQDADVSETSADT